MRISVTGATGFIGSHLVRVLLEQGHILKTLSRNQCIKGTKSYHSEITGHIPEEFFHCDVLYNIAGILGGSVNEEKLFRVNVQGTKNIVKRLNKQKLVFVSSAGVYGPCVKAKETDKFGPSNLYERSKVLAEIIVKGYGNHVILRPEFVYGPGDTHVLSLFKAVKHGRFFLIGDGGSMLHPTYVEDLVAAMVMSMQKTGQYNIAGTPITVKDFIRIMTEELEVSMPMHLPKALGWGYANTIGRLPYTGLSKSRYDFFTKTRTLDTTKAEEELGLCKMRLEEGLRKTIEWYKDNGYV